MEKYFIYLRKSRTDAEAEARGEGETLARHEKALLELAHRQKLNITSIYKEIVSGESIATRPVMQQVLQEVESGLWTGCLVMEVERLARGDTIDQGIVAQTFKFSDTKIITPMKTYDPENEFDEEYFEFGLFMSRREYKTTNRRLQRGRQQSVKEGKFIGNRAPYGYRKIKIENDKGFTLEIVPEQAEVVRLMYEWCVYGISKVDNNGEVSNIPAGNWAIAKELNARGIKPPMKNDVDKWRPEVVREIINNPANCGLIRSNLRKEVKKMIDGKVTKTHPRNMEPQIFKGLHEPIISEELFKMAEQRCRRKAANRLDYDLKNPLAGLIYCCHCNHSMIYRPYYNNKTEVAHRANIRCKTIGCPTVASYLDILEESVIFSLGELLKSYKVKIKSNNTGISNTSIKAMESSVEVLEKEIESLESQLEKIHDLLEKGIYSVGNFLDRSAVLAERIQKSKSDYESVKNILQKESNTTVSKKKIIPRLESAMNTYNLMPNPRAKNELLRTVIEKIIYTKDARGLNNFEIDVITKVSDVFLI